MKVRSLLFLAKLNFIFPSFLGFAFIRYKKFLKKNRVTFDNTQALLEVVNQAKESVPFYKNSIKESIDSFEAFEKHVPLIDKDIVMAQWNDFLLEGLDEAKVIEGTTGGTSGKPLKLIIPKSRHVFELNTMFSMWANIGWKGQLRGVIRNKHLPKGQVYTVDPIRKEVIFDGFNTDVDYYEALYTALYKHNIQFIHAYPSSAYQFALFLKNENKDTSFIKGFLCGSEAVTPLQRQLICEVLNLKLYSWYGHSEKLILGGPCSGNDAIHIEPTYGYFELVNEKGEVIKNEGEVGEMVGTTLHNPYMPLIRYKTGDFAEYAGDYCEHCKRHLPLIKKIQGRWDKNKIYLSDGSYVSITALNLHSDLYHCINGMQYIQKQKGELEVYLIKGDGFDAQIEKHFNEHFEQSLLGKCRYQIVFTDKILKEQNGKFLPLKQYIED